MFTIKYNRTTNHIAGIAERTKGSAMNYAVSACPTISRSRNLASGKQTENLAEALEAARKAGGRKLCKHCESAAVAALRIAQLPANVTMVQVVPASLDGSAWIGCDAEGNTYDLDANKAVIRRR